MTGSGLAREPVAWPARPGLAQSVVLPWGVLEWAPSPSRVLVAAPHGTHDQHTAELAMAVARRLGAGYVVARGFTPDVRINVNRPTERAARPDEPEVPSDRARATYAAYRRRLLDATGGNATALYVEIHGNRRRASSTHIETASKGFSATEAGDLKAQYAVELTRACAACPGYPALALLVEPVDPVYWTAAANKRLGVLACPTVSRALHVELPRAARSPALLPATSRLVAAVVARAHAADPGR